MLQLQQCSSPCILLWIQLEIKKSNNLLSKLPHQLHISLDDNQLHWYWYWSSHFFTQPLKILSIDVSICRFWAMWYIVPSYNTMHVAEHHFLAGSIRLWKFFTTLPEGTRLLDFWVHYPTLPYPKLKNHYPSGPGKNKDILSRKNIALEPSNIFKEHCYSPMIEHHTFAPKNSYLWFVPP